MTRKGSVRPILVAGLVLVGMVSACESSSTDSTSSLTTVAPISVVTAAPAALTTSLAPPEPAPTIVLLAFRSSVGPDSSHRRITKVKFDGLSLEANAEFGQIGTLTLAGSAELRRLIADLDVAGIPQGFEGEPGTVNIGGIVRKLDSAIADFTLELLVDGRFRYFEYSQGPPTGLAEIHEFLFLQVSPLGVCRSTDHMKLIGKPLTETGSGQPLAETTCSAYFII